MNIKTGQIKTDITDAKLQQLVMETLLAQTNFPPELKTLLKSGAAIQGIMNAEAMLWELNDDMPSIPDAWGRALFAMALPVRGIVEMDKVGWIAAAGVAGASASAVSVGTVATRFGLALALGVPAGWVALASAGIGALLVEGLYGLGAALLPNPNSTVGRGQIGQATWDEAIQDYGTYFSSYLDKVMQAIELKKQMNKQIEAYKLNDISVKYNPMDKKNVKVLENFMIGAVLLMKTKRAAERIAEGRSAEDALKYGVAAYHAVDMDDVNEKLGRSGALIFPSEAEFASLGTKRKEHYDYVNKAVTYAKSH